MCSRECFVDFTFPQFVMHHQGAYRFLAFGIPLNVLKQVHTVGTCNFGNIIHFSQLYSNESKVQNILFTLSFACGANVQMMGASARHHYLRSMRILMFLNATFATFVTWTHFRIEIIHLVRVLSISKIIFR